MKKGDKVRYVSADMHKLYPEFYPKQGTTGEIENIDEDGTLWVQWPAGSTSLNDCWTVNDYDVQLIT